MSYTSFGVILWNKALWLDVTSHVTCLSQSQCFSSEERSYAILTFARDISRYVEFVTCKNGPDCILQRSFGLTNLPWPDIRAEEEKKVIHHLKRDKEEWETSWELSKGVNSNLPPRYLFVWSCQKRRVAKYCKIVNARLPNGVCRCPIKVVYDSNQSFAQVFLFPRTMALFFGASVEWNHKICRNQFYNFNNVAQGQWLWLCCQSGRFWYQRSAVRI